jgi:hypothetical protein
VRRKCGSSIVKGSLCEEPFRPCHSEEDSANVISVLKTVMTQFLKIGMMIVMMRHIKVQIITTVFVTFPF